MTSYLPMYLAVLMEIKVMFLPLEVRQEYVDEGSQSSRSW